MALPGEFEYYRARSGLPAGTLDDHKLAYFRAETGFPTSRTEGETIFYRDRSGSTGTLVDARREYFAEQLGVDPSSGTVTDHMVTFFGNPPAPTAPAFSTTSTGTVMLPRQIYAGQPMTVYTVCGSGAAVGRSVYSSSDNSQIIGSGRNSAGTGWFSLARVADESTVVTSFTAPAGPMVVCGARDAAQLSLDTSSAGETHFVATGYSPTKEMIDRVIITVGADIRYTEIWAGVKHDDATRTSRMAALAAQYLDTPFSSTFQQSAVDATDQSTYTFAAQPIGAASSTRRVVVALGWAAAAAVTLTSATIGGVAASVDADTGAFTGNRRVVFLSAVVPTGTTADVVVNLSGAAVRAGIGVWTLSKGAPTGQTNAVVDTSVGALTVTTVAGQVVFATGYASAASGTADTTWTGATERYDATIENLFNTVTGADVVASGTSTVINFNTTGTAQRGFLAAAYAG